MTESMREKMARAALDEIGRQWSAHPIPGDAAPDSWTATGGELDLLKVVDAILDVLQEPSEAAAIAGLSAESRWDACPICLDSGMWAGPDHDRHVEQFRKCVVAMIAAIREGK